MEWTLKYRLEFECMVANLCHCEFPLLENSIARLEFACNRTVSLLNGITVYLELESNISPNGIVRLKSLLLDFIQE